MSDRVIWKYPLELQDTPTLITGPPPLEPIHFGEQDNHPKLWCAVRPGEQVIQRKVLIVGTGQPIPDGYYHLGSYQSLYGFVWHLYYQLVLESSQ